MLLSRRALLAAAPIAAAPFPAAAQNLARGVFTHGVASGDPGPDSVILWTRFIGAESGRIGWEIADDEAFAHVAARGEAEARFSSDFCVKVEARGLQAGRRYFYRFLSGSGPSPMGQTLTAPREASRLTLAVFSCANFPFGYFHAYGHAAARADIDLVVHTGDYIYEIQRGAYPSAAETVPGRIIDPVNETVSLSDYYQRYATYHTDANLLELRRLKPMTAVWDDHEIANDAWRDGAQQHQTATEGLYTDRIAAAAKAYFDWMPIRRPDPRTWRLYRHIDWGGLARILLLDTRYIGRDEQLNYRDLVQRMAQSGADARALAAEFRAGGLDDPNRTLMGAAQERWFAETLAQSKQNGQTWQIVVQQLVVADQIAPIGLTRLLDPNVSPGSRAWFSGAEQLTQLGLPWNLDAWAGYPAARTRFLQACATHANNAVVLGGDSHNCWFNNLAAPGAQHFAALEFAGGSVTSPGFERSLTNAQSGERENTIRAANPHLAWCDLTHRGYGALTFTHESCTAEWLAFADVRAPHATAPAVTRLGTSPSRNAGPGGWAA